MEESAAAAYYFSGGRNNWSFSNLEGVAQFPGKLTFDVGSSVVGPETLVLKSGAQSAKVEAIIARDSLIPVEPKPGLPLKLEPDGSVPSDLLPDSIRGDGMIAHPAPPIDLVAQSDRRMGELLRQYADKNIAPADFRLTIDGKYLKADPGVSVGAPVFVGASDAMVERYFMQLAGVDALPVPKSVVIAGKPSTIYTLVRSDGVKINLSNGSSSAASTQAKWTIDIIDPPGVKARRVEVKFR